MFTEQEIIDGRKLLLAQVGKQYIFGHEVALTDPNPLTFDCSELVQWFYHQMGRTVPDGSYNQFDDSKPVDTPMPFDLGFWRGESGVYHVALSFDTDTVVHAKNARVGVVRDDIYKFVSYRDFAGWRRPQCLLV